MYKLCLLDLDGTLTDSKVGILNSARYALGFCGVSVPDDSTLNMFLGPPLRESFRDFCKLNEATVEVAVTKYREYFANKGMFENRLYSGIACALEKLHKNNIVMMIATSKATIYAEKIIKHFEIEHYFDLIMGCEMDGRRSSKTEIIAAALDGVQNVNRKHIVMVGDRKHDIIGARANEIDSLGVTWGYGSIDELKSAGATRIIANIDDLVSMILSGV